jgi:probable HAF family extracellular repeat protein
MKPRFLIPLAAAVALVGVTGSRPARSQTVAPPYTITDLGTLGGAASRASAINNNGQVTGEADNAAGAARAFRWSAATGLIDMGMGRGFVGGQGDAINNLGQVAGAAGQKGSFWQAVFWSAPGQFQQLLSGNGQSEAYGINDAGEVVGIDWNSFGTFLSAVVGGKRKVTIIAPGQGLQGLGINAYGQVIIHNRSNGTFGNPFSLWTPAVRNGTTGTNVVLGDSTSGALNDGGQVVFGNILWTPDTPNGMTGSSITLGALPSPYPQYDGVGATALNNAAQVVGSQESVIAIDANGNATYADYVWIWDAANGMRNLNDLNNDGIPDYPGWTLTGVAGINDAGQIAGTGSHNGLSHAFVLTPQ